MKPDYSIYVHVPFCTHRCAYCDFNTYAGQERLIPAYVQALCKEMEFVGNASRVAQSVREVHTIFFGGGTPSLLTPGQFETIFESLRQNFTLREDAEITIEANPGTVSCEDLTELHRIGINRISYGVQSANTEELRMLERIHDFLDVIEAVRSARKAGFRNLNLDVIYGLPEQTLETWQTTVNRILDLHPEHISAYALTLEHGTPFGRWASKGLLPMPDPDLAAEMYEWLSETLEANGYVQYEISNWAKPGYECRHNLQYWRGLPYLAFGAGAHGYANGYRYSNVLRIKTYIERITNNPITNYSITNYPNTNYPNTNYPITNYPITNYEFPLSPTTVNHHKQTLQEDMSEFMMTGLRLTQEGVSEEEFYRRFSQPLHTVYGKEIDGLLKLGLLENGAGSKIKISRRGRLLGNQVFMRFV